MQIIKPKCFKLSFKNLNAWRYKASDNPQIIQFRQIVWTPSRLPFSPVYKMEVTNTRTLIPTPNRKNSTLKNKKWVLYLFSAIIYCVLEHNRS